MIRLLRDYPLYQLKVTLIDSEPEIWRRLQVKKETTLAKLHDILQIVMGWYDSHLHEFRLGELTFGEPVPDEDCEVIGERGVRAALAKRRPPKRKQRTPQASPICAGENALPIGSECFRPKERSSDQSH